MNTILEALRRVGVQGRYRWIALAVFALFLPLYLVTLPASYVGGLISLKALTFLDAKLTAFALVMAALVALLAPLMLYLIRHGHRSAKSTAAGGILIGVFAPMLCCSPLLPLLMGSLAALLPALSGAAGIKVQYFIATHQTELLAAAVVLLVIALYQNARKVVQGAACRI
ncbi:MAG TPA: hypothetical protein ENN42_09625 [Thioalkalivibrio sp.]|nr:hypothetical protein [Thioalkalivibrio sp.]